MDLNETKHGHGKVKDTEHLELSMADYLMPNTMTNTEAKFFSALEPKCYV